MHFELTKFIMNQEVQREIQQLNTKLQKLKCSIESFDNKQKQQILTIRQLQQYTKTEKKNLQASDQYNFQIQDFKPKIKYMAKTLRVTCQQVLCSIRPLIKMNVDSTRVQKKQKFNQLGAKQKIGYRQIDSLKQIQRLRRARSCRYYNNLSLRFNKYLV